ncbi:MAG: formate C-acetyltransferase [Parvularcula sp.]|nr:formate C-acetyltransferase [Parvularcula sp.]
MSASAQTLERQAGHHPRSERIARQFSGLEKMRSSEYRVCIEKAKIVTESFRKTEGQSQVIRVARALEAVLTNINVFIEPDDLLAGNLASKPGGVELSCLWAPWDREEILALRKGGFIVDDADVSQIEEMNEYWATRSLTARMTSLYNDERIWPYAQLGVVLPPFRNKEEGWGPGGMIGCGWGVHHEISQIIYVPDYGAVLKRGLNGLIDEAEQKLKDNRLDSAEAINRAELLTSIIISLKAIITYAGRLADEAAKAAAQTPDVARKKELLALERACRHAPANPARNFVEAFQSLWIIWSVLLPSGVLSYGRLDQLLGEYYARDVESGAITRDEALEFFQWLRVKDSHIVITSGQTHRDKYGGLSKWHNCVIGGQNENGDDVTNEVTHLILEAAHTCPAPHPSLTMRVHEKTPHALMDRALSLIATGVGLPAMLADKSCIDFLTREGVDIETARNYAVAGCLGVNITGASRMVASPMFVATLVLKFALYGGVDPRSGEQVGPHTPSLEEAADFDSFYVAVKSQLAHFLSLQGEFNNITIDSYGKVFPQPVESALSVGGIGADKNILGRTMPFENGSALNPIGLINVADSLAAIKKLVFEEREISAKDMLRHLREDWRGEGGEEARRLALAAPKYGNDNDYVDWIAADLYDFCARHISSLTTSYGGRQKPSALTIGTCVVPAGQQTGATPDGRAADDSIADESLSPMRKCDLNGVEATFKSALKIDQGAWQSMAFDLRVNPQGLLSEKGRRRIEQLIRNYFAEGGKHIQFNAFDEDTLRRAQKDPASHRDLVVRIGGCSVFFVQLSKKVQDEIINRTEINPLES